MDPEPPTLALVVTFPSVDEDEKRDEEFPIHTEYNDERCPHGHKRTTIHTETRKLVCRDCGAELDPFDFLLRLSGEGDRYRAAIVALKHRRDYLSGQVTELERQERNAKNRLKRARARAGEA